MASSANAPRIEPIKRIRMGESLLVVLEIASSALSSGVHPEAHERSSTMISNLDFNFAHNPMPASPRRQSQISLRLDPFFGWPLLCLSTFPAVVRVGPVAFHSYVETASLTRNARPSNWPLLDSD